MKLKSFANILSTLIILAFLGFVFYLGWEQLELKENTYGIVYTKTSGWRDKPLSTNGFNWSFEKVIPTNYTVHKFKIEEESLTFKKQGFLPSYKLYLVDNTINEANFKFNYKVTIDYKLKAESLSGMVKSGTFTQESYESWKNRNNKKIEDLISIYIDENIVQSNLKDGVYEILNESLPHYIFTDLILEVKKPDIELYNRLKGRYLSILETKSEAEVSYISKSLEQQNDEILKLDLLRKYGEVFSQYPIMIEYLKVDNEKLLDRAELKDFIQPRSQN